MPNLEPASPWPGRALRTGLSCALLLLGGCAALQQQTGGFSSSRTENNLEFLSRAMDGTASTREAMWRETQSAERSQNTQLRLALLQSVPDSSAYDSAAAQRSLRALLAQNPPEDIAVVARVRLNELRSSTQCLGETQDLRRRLAQVVNIEREIDSRGH